MVNLLDLILRCLAVGALTPGGMAGMRPALFQELVEKGGYLSQEEFLYSSLLGQVTPGPSIVGFSLAGFKWGGIAGAVAVLGALVIPSVLCVLLLAEFRRRLPRPHLLDHFLVGIRLAVPGVLAALAWRALR